MIVVMILRQNRRKSCEGIYHGDHGNFYYHSTVNMQVQGGKTIGVEKRRELNFSKLVVYNRIRIRIRIRITIFQAIFKPLHPFRHR